MAVKLRQPGQFVIVASAAVLVFAGLLAAPVLAAPERGLLCDDSAASSPAVSPHELTATPVSNSEERLENHLLRPNSDAAIRGAFPVEGPAEDSEVEAADAEASEVAVPESGAHSASGQKRPVYKMYRRDI